jgi:hypothetical protein
MKLLIHKVINGGVFYDEEEGMGWVCVLAQQEGSDEIYEEEVYADSVDDLYKIVRETQKATLEPYVIDLGDEE